MQKLDFVNGLLDIANELESKSLVEKFDSSFAKPGVAFDFGQLVPILFRSKSNYDRLKQNSRYSAMLMLLSADEIFSEKNLHLLTVHLRSQLAKDILIFPAVINLYNFHKSLLSTLQLSKEMLISDEILRESRGDINDGVIIFRIAIEGEGLEPEKYINILTALQELIAIVEKILSEEQNKTEVILFDSGSDTNLGVKTGIETAKSLFMIFKEIWDFIISNRHYRFEQNSKTLLNSLVIRTEIDKKIKEGVITEDEGKQYMHIIKTRADSLIGLKVLPKKIIDEKNVHENAKLLAEYENLRMIQGRDFIGEL
ncbi:hypothetical protein [Chryseolinea soli]|uniref:Uncharacterized protein n=1 Tax=Chryseolinea soli TaxID=2321403 RepID=A0A385SHE0_9BACT|nr:hypothetical protein [Chryseolinea soli]AYB29335.1 hypothetical protein D4L85_01490 [Chryseolinea soli]